MNWIDATLQFPPERLAPEFLAIYRERYSDPETGWAFVHWDDIEKTRRRKASFTEGSISPLPIYDQPEPEDDALDEREPVALKVECGWPERFILDLRENAYPDFFEGITEITEE